MRYVVDTTSLVAFSIENVMAQYPKNEIGEFTQDEIQEAGFSLIPSLVLNEQGKFWTEVIRNRTQ